MTPTNADPLEQGFEGLLERGVRFARKLAIASVLAGVGGIAIGAALTDNWFAQIFLTLFAALVLWVPMLAATLWAGRRLARKPAAPNHIEATATVVEDRLATSWRRLGVAHRRARADRHAATVARPLADQLRSAGDGCRRA